MQPALRIRRARPDEAERLTALMTRSKAHWGYSQEMLDGWRSDLTITGKTTARDPVYCAEVDGELAGMMHLTMLDATEALLDDLFVEPAFMGAGVGGALWRQAVAVARDAGATALVFDADPNARPFYQHMGATITSWVDSSSVAERRLPGMRYTLPER